jgi:hypothetical protein
MNKKQLVTIWICIAIIVLLILAEIYLIFTVYPSIHPNFLKPLVLLVSGRLVIIVAAVIVGLTCTFAGKKDKKPKDE